MSARSALVRSLTACALAIVAVSAAAETTKNHVIYVHGRIVQDKQSRRPQQVRFGYYELDKILDTFRQQGFEVTGEMRPRDASESASADVVVRQVKDLLASGVSADHVTVVGASMGGGITLVAAERLQNPGVRFAVLGVCLSQIVTHFLAEDLKAPAGHILAIRELTDESTQGCAPWKATTTGPLVASEIVLNTGLSHGFLYQPRPEWVKPVVAFVQAK